LKKRKDKYNKKRLLRYKNPEKGLKRKPFYREPIPKLDLTSLLLLILQLQMEGVAQRQFMKQLLVALQNFRHTAE
jgi:hypothetical protein